VGADGERFAWALHNWHARLTRRLAPELGAQWNLPTAREINGRLSRGSRRLRRRMAARKIASGMMLEGYTTARAAMPRGRRAKPPVDVKAFGPRHDVVRSLRPSFQAFVMRRLRYWAGAVKLKDAPVQWGGGDRAGEADTAAWRKEALKSVRLAYRESLPVLHMAQAFYEAVPQEVLFAFGGQGRVIELKPDPRCPAVPYVKVKFEGGVDTVLFSTLKPVPRLQGKQGPAR
jgi:hypothetical protein